MPSILLIGASGMFGSDLKDVLECDGYDVESPASSELDVTDFDKLREYFKNSKASIVINASAYTQVDKAEEDQQNALKINGGGPRNLALCSEEFNKKLVHISTDYVFDGEIDRHYVETDKTNPVGFYGLSKLKGEIFIEEILKENYLIVRTSWLYGPNGNNFVKTIIRLAREREELNIVGDQFGTPTYTINLAHAVVNLIKCNAQGMFNYSDNGEISWYDFAEAIAAEMDEYGMEKSVKKISSITTAEFPTPAKRPKYSVLNKAKYESVTGVKTPDWQCGLKDYFKRIKN